MSAERFWWIIRITGYGDRAFYGTEADAEEKRAMMADKYNGVGRKEKADAKNVTHRDRVFDELTTRRALRAEHPSAPEYQEEYPALVE